MKASPLAFPCDYPVKVMGRRTPEFRPLMLEVLARETGVSASAVAERPSRDGNYLSLTCTVRVESRVQLDSLYRALHATGLVLIAL
jgi:putative lipoic acid-binding regulatory protein